MILLCQFTNIYLDSPLLKHYLIYILKTTLLKLGAQLNPENE